MDEEFRQIDVPTGDCLRQGWELAKDNLGPFIGYSVILLAIHAGLATLPIIGWAASAVINPALSAGYFIYARRRLRHEPADFATFFRGFDYLGQLFLVGLVTSILISIGFVLFIVPGLYLLLGYWFASFLVVARRLEFWPALETSRRAVTANLGSMIVLALALIGVNIAGLLACLVGVLVTIPWTYCASIIAFEKVFGEETVPAPPPIPGPAAA